MSKKSPARFIARDFFALYVLLAETKQVVALCLLLFLRENCVIFLLVQRIGLNQQDAR